MNKPDVKLEAEAASVPQTGTELVEKAIEKLNMSP